MQNTKHKTRLNNCCRLGTATEEMIEIFLAEGRLVSALQLGELSCIFGICLFCKLVCSLTFTISYFLHHNIVCVSFALFKTSAFHLKTVSLISLACLSSLTWCLYVLSFLTTKKGPDPCYPNRGLLRKGELNI